MSKHLRSLIHKHGLGKYEANLLALAAAGARIRTAPVNGRTLAPRVSKFGGKPDLPRGFEWPMRGQRPLTFIAQINLSMMPDGVSDWPRCGTLSFFYDITRQPWGFDPKDGGSWLVAYFEPGTRLTPIAMPLKSVERNRNAVLAERMMVFSKVLTIPPPENPALRFLLVSKQERLAYLSLYEEMCPALDDGHHQAFGWPQIVQNDMEVQCQLTSQGIHQGGIEGAVSEAQAAVYAAGAPRWTLLLQLAHDEDLGIMFGDMGRLYFLTTAESRGSLNFDETWVILQCT